MNSTTFDNLTKCIGAKPTRRHLIVFISTALLSAVRRTSRVTAQAECADGLIPCDYRGFTNCIDPISDAANCGACNNSCYRVGVNVACIDGICVSTCAPGMSDCGGGCVDLSADQFNCGSCGVQCPSGEAPRGQSSMSACVEGMCQIVCLDGFVLCGSSCSDLVTDHNNCGSCGTVCSDACVSGECGASGPTPTPVVGHARRIAEMLLTIDDLPIGFAQLEDAKRSLKEVSANYTDPKATLTKFHAWGWRSNVIRRFAVVDTSLLQPQDISGIFLSIHRFTKPTGAAAALDYSFGDQSGALGSHEMKGKRIGDKSRELLTQATPYDLTVYVQNGPILIRLTLYTDSGYPDATARELLIKVLMK